MKIYGDFLTRLDTVENIIAIVESSIAMKKPVTFSIEGDWGRGKTWIVDRVADGLMGIDLSQANNPKVKKIDSGDVLVFKYNAWEKDYYTEPLLAILITIINQLNKELLLENIVKAEISALYDETKDILEDALRAISQRVIGIDVVDIGKRGIQVAKKVKAKSKIEVVTDCEENNIERDIKIVVKALERLSQLTPIVFIVDELDRCLPEYAVKTLERLHHIFAKINPSVTIISVNEHQLKNTVKQMFGEDISFESYLRKFVDFRLALDAGSADQEELQTKLKDFFNLFDETGDTNLHNELLSSFCEKMTAREFERACNNAMLCHSLAGKDTKHLSKDCAMAEIMLFVCKIAIEKEKSRGNIVPVYANDANTKLGKYIRVHFSKVPSRTLLQLSKSRDVIHYICMKGLLTADEFEKHCNVLVNSLLGMIDDYYDTYIRYYKMIK